MKRFRGPSRVVRNLGPVAVLVLAASVAGLCLRCLSSLSFSFFLIIRAIGLAGSLLLILYGARLFWKGRRTQADRRGIKLALAPGLGCVVVGVFFLMYWIATV